MLRGLITRESIAFSTSMQSYKKIPDGVSPPGFLSYKAFEMSACRYFFSTFTVVPSDMRTMLTPFCISLMRCPLML